MEDISEPWGIPAFVEKDSDDVPSTTTLILRSEGSFLTICEVLVLSQRLSV